MRTLRVALGLALLLGLGGCMQIADAVWGLADPSSGHCRVCDPKPPAP
jgi:hypothetical protein